MTGARRAVRGLRLAGVLAALAALAVPAGGVAGAQPAVPVGAAVAAAPRARLDAGAPHGNVCTGQTRVDTEAAGVAGRACAPPAPVLDRRAARREPPPDGRGRRLGVVLGLEVRLVPVVPLCGGRTTAAQCEAAAP